MLCEREREEICVKSLRREMMECRKYYKVEEEEEEESSLLN